MRVKDFYGDDDEDEDTTNTESYNEQEEPVYEKIEQVKRTSIKSKQQELMNKKLNEKKRKHQDNVSKFNRQIEQGV